MSRRVDTVSRLIHASPATIYQAFTSADAVNAWLPPQGMTGVKLAFTFRERGVYRMRLTYNDPRHTPGKTAEDADEVAAIFVGLVPHERIEQALTFESSDSEFSGEMRIVWVLKPVRNGTRE